jgi:hypothetical protein
VAFLAPEGVAANRFMFAPGALTWRDPAPFMFLDKTTDRHQEAVFVGNLTNFRRALVATLEQLTKPRIEAGKIYGHGAGWGTCHTAFRNACVTAPSCDYKVWSGNIYQHPNGDIHAPLHLSAEEAAKWYEAHCDLVATAAVGEDEHGIWVEGDTELEDGEVFLSGDWRAIDGQLELVSFLVVENPGFPTALVASDVQTALVGAGIVTPKEEEDEVFDLLDLEAAFLRSDLFR